MAAKKQSQSHVIRTINSYSAAERRRREQWASYNTARTQLAAREHVKAAKYVLDNADVLFDKPLSAKHRAVLKIRIAFPNANLTELASHLDMTKNQYWSHLRRLLSVLKDDEFVRIC